MCKHSNTNVSNSASCPTVPCTRWKDEIIPWLPAVDTCTMFTLAFVHPLSIVIKVCWAQANAPSSTAVRQQAYLSAFCIRTTWSKKKYTCQIKDNFKHYNIVRGISLHNIGNPPLKKMEEILMQDKTCIMHRSLWNACIAQAHLLGCCITENKLNSKNDTFVHLKVKCCSTQWSF